MTEWEVIGLVSDIFKSEVVNNEGIFTITKREDTDKKVFINIWHGLIEDIYCSDPDLEVCIIDHDNDYEDIVKINEEAIEEQKNYYKIN